MIKHWNYNKITQNNYKEIKNKINNTNYPMAVVWADHYADVCYFFVFFSLGCALLFTQYVT